MKVDNRSMKDLLFVVKRSSEETLPQTQKPKTLDEDGRVDPS